MRSRAPVLLVALGAIAFFGFLAALLPASLLARLLPQGVEASTFTGTVWAGRVESVRSGPLMLAAVEWRCAALPLLVAQLRCRVALDMQPGRLTARTTLRPGGALSVDALNGAVPLAAVGPAGGWRGELRFENVELELRSGRPQPLSGTVIAADLRAPQPGGARLGSYALEFGEGFASPGVTGGRLRDLGGPLSLRGTVRIEPPGRYLAQGEVAPRPGASQELLGALSFLAPPDASGHRSFTFEGSL